MPDQANLTINQPSSSRLKNILGRMKPSLIKAKLMSLSKKKKLVLGGISVFLVVLSIVGIIAATSRKTPAKVVPTPVTLNFWGLNLEEESMKGIIEQFEAENPLIKVKYEKQSDTEYREKLTERLKIKNLAALPDIVEIDESWLDQLYPYFNKITDSNISSRFSVQTIKNNSVNNSLYAVPFKFDSLAIAYNKQHLAENKLDETSFNRLDWSSLLTRAKELTVTVKAKDQNNKEYDIIRRAGMAIGNPKYVTNGDKIFELLLIQNDANIYNSKTKKFTLDEKFNDVVNFYTNFAVEKVWDDTLGNDIQAFATGKVSMIIVRSGDIDKIKASQPDLQFATVLPARIGGIKNISLSTSLASPLGRPYTAQTVKFLEYLSRPEHGTKLFNSTNRKTFVPAQLQSLSQISRESPFSVYSDINSNAERMAAPDFEATSKVLKNFLSENFEATFAKATPGSVTKFKFDSNRLQTQLNALLLSPTPSVKISN